MSTRETAVAGQFYPARADEIQKMLQSYNQILDAYFKKDRALSQLRPKRSSYRMQATSIVDLLPI